MTIQPGGHKHEAPKKNEIREPDRSRDEALRNEDLRDEDLRGKDMPGKDMPGKDVPGKDVPGKDLRDDNLGDKLGDKNPRDKKDRPGGDEAQQPVPVQNQAPVAARTRLFEERQAAGFREQWREVQAGFVDEPRAAVREAETLVSRMMDQLTAQLNEQKRALGGHSESVDTEQLRIAMQRYRSLFDQMLQV